MPKQLIISNYDIGTDFEWVVIENNIVTERSKSQIGLSKYGLYDEEWNWFAEKRINKNNDKIKEFDTIIVCEDGNIAVHVDFK